jgi:hypothetical protein
MLRSWVGLAGLLLASPAIAGSYRIVLDRPANGRLLTGHMGLQAADDRTAATLVRVVAPGNSLDVRGTVRVLVMNLGARSFVFGPDQVTLQLGDGTVLKPTPIDEFEKRKVVAEGVSARARTIDMRNRNDLAALAGQMGSGPSSPIPGVATISAPATSSTAGQDRASEDAQLPHAEVLNGIYQLLIPLNVEPQHAWGGYYVFDVPRAVQRARTDQPLTIIVRTGAEEHRFAGMLRWK